MVDISIKILIPALLTFCIGIGITPSLTHYLYKYKAWKKVGGKHAIGGSVAHEFNKLHADLETKTPRMGGIVIWGSVILCVFIIACIGYILPNSAAGHVQFLSRSQTWVPLGVLIVGSLVGLVNDLLDIRPGARGLRLRERLLFVVVLSGYIGWWMYSKLEITTINVPFSQPIYMGAWIIALFMLVSFCLYASGVIDGVDGLSGGVFASIFASYAIIAGAELQYNLAALCASITGGILAFLWFNVPPARFYMSETGTMGLTLSLASILFLTDAHGGGIGIAVFPIIGFLLAVTVVSNIVQILSKRIFKRKVFRVAPLHHHFEAIGWSSAKVSMRYWILSIMFAVTGVMSALVGLS